MGRCLQQQNTWPPSLLTQHPSLPAHNAEQSLLYPRGLQRTHFLLFVKLNIVPPDQHPPFDNPALLHNNTTTTTRTFTLTLVPILADGQPTTQTPTPTLPTTCLDVPIRRSYNPPSRPSTARRLRPPPQPAPGPRPARHIAHIHLAQDPPRLRSADRPQLARDLQLPKVIELDHQQHPVRAAHEPARPRHPGGRDLLRQQSTLDPRRAESAARHDRHHLLGQRQQGRGPDEIREHPQEGQRVFRYLGVESDHAGRQDDTVAEHGGHEGSNCRAEDINHCPAWLTHVYGGKRQDVGSLRRDVCDMVYSIEQEK